MQICDAIHSRARQTPEKPALIEGDRATSYATLSDQIRKTAAALVSMGVRPGDPVGMFLREGTRHVVTKLAIIQAGAAVFTLDRRGKSDAGRLLERMPDRTKVLSEPGQTMPAHVDLIALDESWDRLVAGQPTIDLPGVAGDNPALIILSSGSTGRAKAVVSTHREHLWRYLQKNLYLPAATSDRYLSILPLTFSAGNNYILYYLMSGSTVVLYPILFSASELVESINRLEITSVYLVPTVLERIVSEAGAGGFLMPHYPKFLLGGAPTIPQTKIRCLDQVTPNLYCIYASSAAGWLAFADPSDSRYKPDSVGRCIATTELQIVDDSDQPLPAGQTGRVRCRGETVTAGQYGGMPVEDPHETYRNGFYYPGDLGHFDDQGYLYLDGRASTLIIRGGINIYPEHIEEVLLAHEAVDEVAVCGISNTEYGENVVAIVVSNRGITVQELRAFSRSNLGVHYVPGLFLCTDQLPRTHAGKIDRKGLPLLADRLRRS